MAFKKFRNWKSASRYWIWVYQTSGKKHPKSKMFSLHFETVSSVFFPLVDRFPLVVSTMQKLFAVFCLHQFSQSPFYLLCLWFGVRLGHYLLVFCQPEAPQWNDERDCHLQFFFFCFVLFFLLKWINVMVWPGSRQTLLCVLHIYQCMLVYKTLYI